MKELRTEPWITPQALEFLDSYLVEHPNARVLEFGSGGSTIWFSYRTPNLTSIEHDQRWYTPVKEYLESHAECQPVDYRLENKLYWQVADTFPGNHFDVVLVDGKDRVNCIKAAKRVVKSGGLLMLDNAERTRYQCVHIILEGWKFMKTQQVEPDKYGWLDPMCQTNWWVKP